MSRTGIPIAPNGSALSNSRFRPAHAVVIELFPLLMEKNTYRSLANLLDLHYYPVYSWEQLPRNLTQFYGVALMNEEYFWNNCIAVNISSYDALNYHACNAASKNYPIVVSAPQINAALADAIDTIGAFSLKNDRWRDEFEAKGYAMPEKPEWVTAEKKGH